jgi:hypothetical protein
MKLIASTMLLIFLCGCVSNQTKNTNSKMTTKDKFEFIGKTKSAPNVVANTKYDERGCVIKPEGYTFDDVQVDKEAGRYYLSNGKEISHLEALSLVPGIEICN